MKKNKLFLILKLKNYCLNQEIQNKYIKDKIKKKHYFQI